MTEMQIIGGGCKVALIGMGIVFIGLLLLILVVQLMHALFSLKKDKPQKTAPAVVPAAPAPAPVSPAIVEEDNQDEVAAVIAAAIQMYLSSETNTSVDPSRLVVRHARREGKNTPVWGR